MGSVMVYDYRSMLMQVVTGNVNCWLVLTGFVIVIV